MSKKDRSDENISEEETLEEVNAEFADETLDDPLEVARQRIVELETENGELKDKYVRAHAEMENVRKRAQTDLEQKVRFAVSEFAANLLSVADNLERALSAVSPQARQEDENLDTLAVGVEMTLEELKNAFEKEEIHPVEAEGERFDPNIHQVVQEVEDPEKPAGSIVSVLQKGYMIKDRLLREAMVIVSRGGGKPEKAEDAAGNKVDTSA